MALGKGLGSLIPKKQLPSAQQEIVKENITPNTGDNKGLSKEERVWQVPISEIKPNVEQPRKHFAHDELENLVSSIQQHGILQPLTITEKADGTYELIAGERRLRAAEIAGFATVPAIIKSVKNDQHKLELALIENIQRQDLNPIEEAFAYRRLMDQFGLTQEEVSKQVGKKRPTVANTVRLLDLSPEIQKALIDGVLSTGKARALLSLKSPKEQWDVFQQMVGEKATVRDFEKVIEKKGQKARKGSVRRDPNLASQEDILEEKLNTKVRITKKGEIGSITFSFFSNEEFKELFDKFENL